MDKSATLYGPGSIVWCSLLHRQTWPWRLALGHYLCHVAYAQAALRDVQAANITEEDIDAIIQKGQRATEELNEKMKQYTENAMKFTMDGGIAYEYKDEEDVPEDAPNLKAIAGVLRSPCLALP